MSKLTVEATKEMLKNMYPGNDYSKVETNNPNYKITVDCPRHGEFNIILKHHINGRGCIACALGRP